MKERGGKGRKERSSGPQYWDWIMEHSVDENYYDTFYISMKVPNT